MSSISAEQCRAARAWLDWSQAELSRRANVSLSTVKDFERGGRKTIANNRAAIQRAFEEQGIRFCFDENGQARGIEKQTPTVPVDSSSNG
jgi:ribosome-binding protein aMBF1 (putative translation factor)